MSRQPSRRLLVVCLCAAWCDSCRDYRATFGALAARFGEEVELAWVDIEDDADALGDLEVENFPTLLVADRNGLCFLGPVTPQPKAAERLLQRALDGALPPMAAGDGLLGRVQSLLRSRDGAAEAP